MNKKFERVILYARNHRGNLRVNESLQLLLTFLHQQKIETVMDIDTAHHFSLDVPVLAREKMDKNRDLIVVVGGDGSLLSAARMAVNADIPVTGINRGRLGFLTDIAPLEIESQLGAILNGRYQEELRFLLHAEIHDDTTTYFQGNALNDVVLSRGQETHLIEFDAFVDKQLVCHYRSDGLIVATPTGSTAYALSAGGPIMHPQLKAIVLVPMFSHSLSSRPLVIDNQATIDLCISANNESELRVSCDGHESRMVKPGQQVRIKKDKSYLRLLHPENYHYYDTLGIKLGWESKYQG